MFGTTFIKDNWDDLTSLTCALGLTGLLYGQVTWALIQSQVLLPGDIVGDVYITLPFAGLVTTISVFAILGGIGLHVASRLVPSIKDEVAKVLGGLFSSN